MIRLTIHQLCQLNRCKAAKDERIAVCTYKFRRAHVYVHVCVCADGEALTQIVVVFLLSLLGHRTGFCIIAKTTSD